MSEIMNEEIIEKGNKELFLKARKSIISFGLFIFLVVLALILKYLFRIEEKQMWPLLVILLGVVFYGIYIQFSLKCPYCGFRLGLQTRLGLPYSCFKCKHKIKDKFFEEWPFNRPSK
jgi:hypothetical protein